MFLVLGLVYTLHLVVVICGCKDGPELSSFLNTFPKFLFFREMRIDEVLVLSLFYQEALPFLECVNVSPIMHMAHDSEVSDGSS